MEPSNEASGDLSYAVVETSSGREIVSGRCAITNIEIDEHLSADSITFYRKRIGLDGPFQFAIDEHPDKSADALTGFALIGINDEVQTYSWEWFNLDSSEMATKLQEQGKVAIEIGPTSCGYEVVRTEFLTDVSLRLTRFFGDPTLEPFWRLTVRQGSWIVWPPGKS